MSGLMIAFAFLAAGTLYAGYKVVTTPVVTHAAMWLLVSFTGVAGLYWTLQAEFLAVVQILVYAGAIMTVVIFAIMLSEMPEVSGQKRVTLVEQWTSPTWGFAPAVVAGALALAVLAGIGQVDFGGGAGSQADVAAIGSSLFTTYVVPFELASVLLLAAMIGAILISRREAD